MNLRSQAFCVFFFLFKGGHKLVIPIQRFRLLRVCEDVRMSLINIK